MDRSLEHGLRLVSELMGDPRTDGDVRSALLEPERALDAELAVVTARRLGFAARSVTARRRNLEHSRPPFLIAGRHPGEGWVVERRIGDHVHLVDPSTGHGSIVDLATLADLAQRIVILEPRPTPDRAEPWRDVILRRFRPVLIEIGIASVVINLLALASPIFLMTVYNKVINHGALQTLDVLAIGMVTLFVFEGLLRALRGYIASHAGGRLDAALGNAVTHRIVTLPLRSIESVSTSQVLERARQLEQVRQFFTSQMPLLLVDIAFVGLFLFVIFYLDPLLGWITFAAMPLFWGLSLLARQQQRDLVEEHVRASAARTSQLDEIVRHALIVKALGVESEMERRFGNRLAEAAWTGFRASHAGSLVSSAGQVLQHVTALVIVYVGARAIIAGDMSIGALIAATILAARTLAPMRQVVGAWQQLHAVRQAFARLDELMSEPGEAAAGATSDPAIQGRITFENVGFRYRADGLPALTGIDLEIAPGETLGIIGQPGSGKSTLAKLILGLEQPDGGRVLIDDHDVQHLAPVALRRQIGIVPQETQLFAGTIADNIALGASDQTPARVMAAARFVGAHDFIQNLPRGYDTALGEGGSGLSSGQRQLISLARAIIRNPRILILDEATSALDPATEEALLTNLKRASRGRTLVIVTHRPQPLAIADRVVQLVDGRIERIGPPRDLAGFARAQPGMRPGGLRSHLHPV